MILSCKLTKQLHEISNAEVVKDIEHVASMLVNLENVQNIALILTSDLGVLGNIF